MVQTAHRQHSSSHNHISKTLTVETPIGFKFEKYLHLVFIYVYVNRVQVGIVSKALCWADGYKTGIYTNAVFYNWIQNTMKELD